MLFEIGTTFFHSITVNFFCIVCREHSTELWTRWKKRKKIFFSFLYADYSASTPTPIHPSGTIEEYNEGMHKIWVCLLRSSFGLNRCTMTMTMTWSSCMRDRVRETGWYGRWSTERGRAIMRQSSDQFRIL